MEITKEVSRSDLLIVKRIREFWQEKVNQEYPMGSFDEFLIKSVTDHVFRKDFG